jgi:hypothetical protein
MQKYYFACSGGDLKVRSPSAKKSVEFTRTNHVK